MAKIELDIKKNKENKKGDKNNGDVEVDVNQPMSKKKKGVIAAVVMGVLMIPVAIVKFFKKKKNNN